MSEEQTGITVPASPERLMTEAIISLGKYTNLSTSSLDAIREAIESGNPLYCIPDDAEIKQQRVTRWNPHSEYDRTTIVYEVLRRQNWKEVV